MKGEGLGFFVNSAVDEDVRAGRLVEISPLEFEPLHRDTAMVVRNPAVLDRPMLADFVREIAQECARVGEIIDDRLHLFQAGKPAARTAAI
jgi:DNA-binding transcriptional LysR family regulator